jgi:hypothetical protein
MSCEATEITIGPYYLDDATDYYYPQARHWGAAIASLVAASGTPYIFDTPVTLRAGIDFFVQENPSGVVLKFSSTTRA